MKKPLYNIPTYNYYDGEIVINKILKSGYSLFVKYNSIDNNFIGSLIDTNNKLIGEYLADDLLPFEEMVKETKISNKKHNPLKLYSDGKSNFLQRNFNNSQFFNNENELFQYIQKQIDYPNKEIEKEVEIKICNVKIKKKEISIQKLIEMKNTYGYLSFQF